MASGEAAEADGSVCDFALLTCDRVHAVQPARMLCRGRTSVYLSPLVYGWICHRVGSLRVALFFHLRGSQFGDGCENSEAQRAVACFDKPALAWPVTKVDRVPFFGFFFHPLTFSQKAVGRDCALLWPTSVGDGVPENATC